MDFVTGASVGSVSSKSGAGLIKCAGRSSGAVTDPLDLIDQEGDLVAFDLCLHRDHCGSLTGLDHLGGIPVDRCSFTERGKVCGQQPEVKDRLRVVALLTVTPDDREGRVIRLRAMLDVTLPESGVYY